MEVRLEYRNSAWTGDRVTEPCPYSVSGGTLTVEAPWRGLVTGMRVVDDDGVVHSLSITPESLWQPRGLIHVPLLAGWSVHSEEHLQAEEERTKLLLETIRGTLDKDWSCENRA